MRITWHGHAFFAVEAASGTTLLVDPFLSGNPHTDLGPDDFDPDFVAVTHGDFFDHAGDAHRFGVPVVCQSLMARDLLALDHPVVDLNIGGRFAHEGLSLTMVHAHHSMGTSATGIERTDYGGVAAGYVIDDGGTTFYHSGDTGLFGDMKHVVRDVYGPEVAAVPIGGHHTMEPEEAAIAAEWIGAETVVPMHYGTFPEIDVDPEAFAERVEGPTVEVLGSGESIDR
jgi:L-ascorbate metabolism protein UlaG (beta-lactamase superfamily)